MTDTTDESTPTEGKRILIVEANPNFQQYFSMVLAGGGYTIKFCTDGSDVVSEVEVWRPHLVLLDLAIPSGGDDPFGAPRFDGFMVLEWLKRMLANTAPPVLALSAMGLAGKQRALEAGAFAVFEKSVERDRLLTAVRIALDEQ